jgi:hypothetical protein
MAADHGPVEAAYRSWVSTIGTLSPRQTAEAEHLYRLAEELDLKSDKPAAALASLSRAIARAADRLRDEKNAAPGVPVSGGPNVVPEDVVDAARLAREQRRAGGA